MEELLPSEVARLVLGFLKENKWEKSWKIFLEECSDLYEYNLLYKRGKLYSTNVNGKSLLDILKEYCSLKNVPQESSIAELSENVSKEKVILEENVRSIVEQVIQKYLPCFCRKSHTRCDMLADVTQINHMSDCNFDKSIGLENETEQMDQSNNTDILEEDDSNGSNDCNGSSVQSKSTDSDTNSSAEEIISKELCKFGGLDRNLQSLEHSESDIIYMKDTIKVEKDVENCTFSQHKSGNDCSKNRNSSQTLNTVSESTMQLHSTKSKSAVKENPNKVLSTTSKQNPSTVESYETMQTNNCSLDQTIKVEPDSSVNSTNKTEESNCSQSRSPVIHAEDNQNSLADTNETAFCRIQSTRGSVNNTANPINLISNQPAYTIHPFASESLPVCNMPYQSLPTYFVQNFPSNSSLLQNNSQYSFIINTPATGSATTLPVAVPGILPNNTGPTLTSVTSLRSHNPSSDSSISNNPSSNLSISNNPLTNMNAADSTNTCEKSQTDATAVLNSVCKAADALFTAPIEKKNTSISKQLRQKSNQKNKCSKKDDLNIQRQQSRSKKKNIKGSDGKKSNLNQRQKSKYENLAEWNKKQSEIAERSTCRNDPLKKIFKNIFPELEL